MPKPRLEIIVVVVMSALGAGVACTGDPRVVLDEEWRRMMQCSAYFSMRAAGERESRTAAARRTADAAQADAAVTFDYSHELGRLAGRPLVDTDSGLREIGAELRHASTATCRTLDDCDSGMRNSAGRSWWKARLA